MRKNTNCILPLLDAARSGTFAATYREEPYHISSRRSTAATNVGFPNGGLELRLNVKKLHPKARPKFGSKVEVCCITANNGQHFPLLKGSWVIRRRGVPSVNSEGILKIDRDIYVDTDWIRDFIRLVIAVCEGYGITVVSIKMCRSHHKWLHFYIHITPRIEPEFANRLQFLLGDDARRVDFNRARIRSHLTGWNKLFERPGSRLITLYRLPCRE